MDHYTVKRLTSIAKYWNDIAYYQILKFHHKVADVMIKPKTKITKTIKLKRLRCNRIQ